MIISVINLSCSPFPPFSLVSNEPIGFGPEQTFSKEVDDKANAYFQVSNQYTRVSDILILTIQYYMYIVHAVCMP